MCVFALQLPGPSIVTMRSEPPENACWDAPATAVPDVTATEHDGFVDIGWLTAAHRQHGATAFGEMLRRAAEVNGGPTAAIADALIGRIGGLRDHTDIPLALALGVDSGSWSQHPDGPGAFRRLHPYWIAGTLGRPKLEAIYQKYGFTLPSEQLRSLENLQLIEPFTRSWVAFAVRTWACAASPDGQRLASISSSDRSLRLWDARTGTLRESVEACDLSGGGLRECAYTPDGRHVMTISGGGTFTAWDVEQLKPAAKYQINDPWRWRVCAFAPDGTAAVAVGADIHLLDPDDAFSRIAVLSGSTPSVGLGFDATRNLLWSYSEFPFGRLTSWHVPTKRVEHVIDLQEWSPRPQLYIPTFTPDGRFFLAANDNELVIWATSMPARIGKVGAGVAGRALAIAPDSSQAATCDRNGNVRVWALPSLTVLRTWNLYELGCRDIACALAFSPDGSHLIVAEWKGTLRSLNCSAMSVERLTEEPECAVRPLI